MSPKQNSSSRVCCRKQLGSFPNHWRSDLRLLTEPRSLYERGNLTRARPLAQLSLSICNHHPSLEKARRRDLLSRIHDTLGCIANGTNQPEESKENNSEFLKLRKSIAEESGKEDFPLAYAHNQMGCSWMMAKDYEKGCEL